MRRSFQQTSVNSSGLRKGETLCKLIYDVIDLTVELPVHFLITTDDLLVDGVLEDGPGIDSAMTRQVRREDILDLPQDADLLVGEVGGDDELLVAYLDAFLRRGDGSFAQSVQEKIPHGARRKVVNPLKLPFVQPYLRLAHPILDGGDVLGCRLVVLLLLKFLLQ